MKNFTLGSFLAAALVAVTVMMSACDNRVVYNRYQNTPLAGWEKNDTLTFAVPRMDTTAVYSAQLGLRITDDYPFTAVTLIVERHTLPGNAVAVDTLNCQLTNRHGNLSGKGIRFHQYTFGMSPMQLHGGDSLVVAVRHDMKREILPGISDVGIEITKQ